MRFRTCAVMVAFAMFVIALPGCGKATPKSRIDDQPDVFAAFPPDVQEKVRNGQTDAGFPADAVRMALGRADRTYTRTEKDGKVAEVWAYTRESRGTRTGVSIGIGGGRGGGVHTGGGVSVGTGRGYDTYEYLRVVFDTASNRVTAIERTQ